MMVDQASSTIAGPAIGTPDGRRSRSKRGVWCGACGSNQHGPTLVGSGTPPDSASAPNVVLPGHQGADAQALHLPMLVGGVAVDVVVAAAEIAAQRGEIERMGEGHFHRGALADIAHQGGALDRDRLVGMALALQWLHQRLQHAVVQGAEAVGVPVGAQHAHGLLLGVAHVGHDAAQRREARGKARHDDLADAELARQAGGMHGAGAAEGEQGALAAVDAALDGHPRQRPHHRGIGDPLHAQRQFDDADAEAMRERRQGRFRRSDVEGDGAAQAPRRIEIAQHRVGVGHGGQRAAAAVGGGAGLGAGALRADRQAAGAVCHQRAAAGADRFDGDHGLAHRPAGELGIGGDLGRAAGDQADIGRRAAHVEAQDLVEPQRGRDMGRGGNAGGRAGQRHGQRPPRGGLGRGHAAGRMHDVQARALAPRAAGGRDSGRRSA